MDSINEKQPLLADPEQLAFPPVYQAQLARRADRRRCVARRLRLVVVAVALFFFFSSSRGVGFVSALLSSIIPALESPRPIPSGPSGPSGPSDTSPGSSPNTPSMGISQTPLEGPLVLPSDGLCADYNGGSGLKSYPLATYPVVFDGQHTFAFRQNATDHNGHGGYHEHYRHVRVLGEVVVRKAAAGKAPSVDVEALSNDDRIRTVYGFASASAEQSLHVSVDDRIHVEASPPGYSRGHPCLVVRATVWLPEVGDDSDDSDATTHLKNLLIANTHLGIQLIDDTSLVVDDYARLTSVIGGITASRAISEQKQAAEHYRFEAAETDVETTSSAIAGPWTLRNRLHFGSVSGSVHVAVAVAAASPATADADKVADLSFRTVSGSIAFEEVSAADVHPHTLSVSTQSGTIRGAGSFARSARLHSTSGSIAAALRPVALDASADEKATLNTNTVSGSTEITLKPADGPDKPLDFLESVHTAVSGSLRLHYPASWAGGIHLKSVSSSLAVEGKGVHVVPDRRPRWPPRMQRRIEATKDVPGEDAPAHAELSSIVAETVSGSVRLDFPL